MNTKVRDTIWTVVTYLLALLPFIWFGAEMYKVEKILLPDASTGKSFFFLACSLVVLCIWYFIHIIIHEAGHLIMGLLTRYRFVSFRIGNLTIVKDGGRLSLKKMTLKGTAGQCIMCPPVCEPEELEDTWYLLGGGLMNLAVSSLSMYLYGVVPFSLASYFFFFLGGIIGIVTCISNLCPVKTGSIANDGYDIFFEGKNKNAKAAMYYVLLLHARMSEVEKVEFISDEILQKIFSFPYEDLTNIYEANLYSIMSCLYIAKGEYEKARQCSEVLYQTDGVLGLFKDEAKCDLLYHEIMGECREEEITKLYDDKMKAYIKATACYPSRKMLMYAYYLIYKEDDAQATRELCELKALRDSCAVKLEGAIACNEAERIKAQAAKKEEMQADFLQ